MKNKIMTSITFTNEAILITQIIFLNQLTNKIDLNLKILL